MATNKNIKLNLDYSDFSGGISECQRKMGLLTEEFKLQQSALGNNASEVDKLALTQSTLSKQIDLQIKIVEQASQKFEALNRSESASEAQVDKAQAAYMKQITKLHDLTNALESVNKKLEENTKKEEDSGNGATKAARNTDNLIGSVANAVTSVTAFGQALKQLVQVLADVATQSTQWADDLVTLSEQMGVTTTTLQEFGYAASFVDVSVETLQDSMTKLTQEMSQAQNGSASAQQAFNNLGVSVQNADGSLRSAEEVFYEVIDALGEIEDPTQRDADAMAIFGRSAQELNGVIQSGSEGFRQYGAEAESLGIIMSQEDVQALAQMQDSFDRLDAVMTASGNRVSAAIAPAFSELADMFAHLPTPILDSASAFRKVWEITSNSVTTASQYVQTLASLRTAKMVTAMATHMETEAEVGLGVAAAGVDIALIPQILLAAVIAAALIALVGAVKELAEAYRQLADATEAATESTQKFSDAASGSDSSSNNSSTSSSGRKGYALGGRVSGRQVWVGEQGAELVELPSGSTVYNHQESRSMTSSNNVFNVTIDAKNVDEFNKVVKVFNGLSQSMNRGGRVNG